MNKKNLAASVFAGIVLTTTCGVALSNDYSFPRKWGANEVKSLDLITGQTEKSSSGLIQRIQSEPARKALEPFDHVADEELNYSGFTFTLSARANGKKVYPVLRVAYNGEAQHTEKITLRYVSCGAEKKENDLWGVGCFPPTRYLELEGPFSKGEVRTVKPDKPLRHPYSKPPYVLLPHVIIQGFDEKLDIGTLIGKGVKIHPRK